MIKFNWIIEYKGYKKMEKTEYIKKISEYDAENAKKILESLKNNLRANKEILESANRIDVQVSKKKIKLETLIEIVDNYKEAYFKNLDKVFIVYYKGDPYLTINLFIQALMSRSKIIFAYDEFMLSTNEILFTIFSKILKEYKIDNLINKCQYSKEKILEIKDLLDAEIIGIGDTTMYQVLNEEGKFYSYYNIMLYCDNEMLVPIKDAIYVYSNENNYELEIVYEDNIEDAINYMNIVETTNIVVLLSNNKNTIKKFKEKINKKLFINENPFIKSYGKIYDYLK